MEYKRNCPNCNKEILYVSLKGLDRAIKINANCNKCAINLKNAQLGKNTSVIRICPKCNNEITYKSVGACTTAINKNSCCKKCHNLTSFNIVNNNVKAGITQNGFKNKKHTLESIENMSKAHKLNSNIYKTKEFSDKISILTTGKNNPMYGKNVYSIWIEKYGKEVADRKMLEKNIKHSMKVSGEKNGMYGKPSPQGSGNGWKGWYKDIFFRSLLELSFLVNYIERFNMSWVSGESKKYNILYQKYDNTNRTYKPDFIINNKFMVEIKPKKLHNTKLIVLKKNAAIKYCNENNLIYKLIDPIKITKKEIQILIDNKNLKFADKTQIKFLNYKK